MICKANNMYTLTFTDEVCGLGIRRPGGPPGGPVGALGLQQVTTVVGMSSHISLMAATTQG